MTFCIATLNLLVFANDRLKISDFGLSQVKGMSTVGPVGTQQWTSPEEMDGRAVTERADVYR